MTRERFGGIAIILAACWFILYGLTGLLSIAIPLWVLYLLALFAGGLLLVGR